MRPANRGARGGDFISDFTAEDRIWMLDARRTDWMTAIRNEDGSVTIPQALRPYVGGMDKIARL